MNSDEINKLIDTTLRMLEEQRVKGEKIRAMEKCVVSYQEEFAALVGERCKELLDELEEQRLADEQAKEIVEMMRVTPAEVLTLSDEDFEKMMNVLENPPEPSEKLKEAFRKHSERVVKSYALEGILSQCDTSQEISVEEAEWMNAEDVGLEKWSDKDEKQEAELNSRVSDILQEKFPRTEEGTEELTRKILEATCEVYGEGTFSVDLENFPNIVVTKEESS